MQGEREVPASQGQSSGAGEAPSAPDAPPPPSFGAEIPQPPKGRGATGQPPEAPKVSQPGGSVPTLEALRYPGSEETMHVADHGKGVLNLHTDDDIAKVRAWYEARMHAASKVQIPFGSSTIFRDGKVTVMLTGAGGGTNILLTSGSD